MKNYFILFVLSVISIASIAQDRSQGRRGYDMSNFNGVVTGKVVDSLDRTPVEYATVALYRQKDSSLVTGALTDESGKFIIEKLKPGRYY
ncbi:MAG: hypothetical protein PWR03_622, partial [Tenuifilum sp.]|uniref:carboxypeptidase-like regulatory domain-containing protein n=1 Tax=Tenuifilum sp. TaxID=2760880 RepID=UPI0024AC55B9